MRRESALLDLTIGELDAALTLASLLAKRIEAAPQLERTLRIARAQLRR